MRNISILVVCPIPYDATSFYRGFGPFNYLQKHYNVSLLPFSPEYTWAEISRADIVFMQRPCGDDHLMVARIAKYCNVPVWIDYDDAYLDIPETNPRHETYEPLVPKIKELCRVADAISVSTERIKSLFQASGISTAIHVIPNAVDDSMFDVSVSTVPRRNVISWRGGDSHGANMEAYKEAIINAIKRTPNYVWAFSGHFPSFIVNHPDIPSERLRLYEHKDIMDYFRHLFDMRPKFAVVALNKDDFNMCRSNISWLEHTLSGAVVIAPDWDVWHEQGITNYQDLEEDIVSLVASDEVKINALYRQSVSTIQKKFTLNKVSRLRMDIVVNLMKKKLLTKLSINNTTVPKKYSDFEFFRWETDRGYWQENKAYWDANYHTYKYLKEKTNCDTVLEIGPGVGCLLEHMLINKVNAYGIDMNPFHREYFVQRNPYFESAYSLGDITKAKIEGDFDLIISIEVFEHIDDKTLSPLIKSLSKSCKFFFFSSTPYASTYNFDHEWGHINVKPTEHWIRLFESNGFKLIDKPGFPAPWACLFQSIS
jgi:2-polyprenyl-3-methyl-5-hydroxy-6-metoxy-1,4-benzoquinol methylase